mmetsp:Transcript_7988/g.22950  ORF Transcript_7988/g.22950 Transcript_7988/m.22950 type:complete len:501 (+) Transcript_7988:100-1602(+)
MELPTAVTSVIDAALDFIYSFQPICEKTVILAPPFLKDYVSVVADAVGMDIDTVTYVFGFFLCYPLGIIMNQIPYGNMRHAYSFVVGAFLLQFTVGVQWVHQMISAVLAYTMILVLPRKSLTYVLPVFAMTYMTLGHLHRQYINYLGWDLDFTSAQMVVTQKLYMIAFNLYDGEMIAKGTPDRAAKKCSKYALKEVPSFLEFLGYLFCFSNCLAGPAPEFAIYNRACDGSLFLHADGKPKGKIPSSVIPSIKPLLVSLLNMGLFVVINGAYPLLDPADPQHSTPAVLTEEFLKNGILYRFAYLWFGLFGIRNKYYFGWKNAEGANNVWYAGFDGFDDKGEPIGWDAACNLDIIGFELAPDIQHMSKEWNKKTSNWLTRYIYIRTGGSLLAVYSLSAFWHGFYPGYYMFFLSVPLLTFCDRLAKKKISPYFSKSRYGPYGIISTIATTCSVNYTVSSFLMLAGSWAFALWKSHYFFGHVGGLVFYAILTFLPKPKEESKKA